MSWNRFFCNHRFVLCGFWYGSAHQPHRRDFAGEIVFRFSGPGRPWQGRKGALAEGILQVLGVEAYVLSDFTRPPDRFVNLYIGFYESQRKGDLIHSPRNCMPGSGWHIVETGREILTDPVTGQTYKVASLVLKKRDEYQMVLYWFHSRGRIIASEYMQKIWLVIDAVFRNRTDGSFVRLITPVTSTQQEAVQLLKEFAGLLKPTLDEYLPK